MKKYVRLFIVKSGHLGVLIFFVSYVTHMKLPLKYKVFALSLIIASPLIGTISAYAATTTLTLTVTSNLLSISAPTNLNLGSSVTFPATFTTHFGSAVAVTDTRGTSTGWISQVLVSPLSTAGNPDIPASVFSYAVGTVTKTGTGTLAQQDAPTPGTATTVLTATLVSSNVSASWIPTLTLTELGTPAGGAYTGTVTSSVF